MKHDLYDLLQAAKADPPPMRHSVDDFVAGGRRLKGRRRVALAGVASAGVVLAVAAAVVVPQVVTRADGGSGPAPAAAPTQKPGVNTLVYPDATFVSAFDGYQVGEFTVSDPVLNTPGYQQATISRGKETQTLSGTKQGDRTYPTGSAALTVYRPGAYDPARFSGKEAVTVNGRPGVFAENLPVLDEPADVPLPPNASEKEKQFDRLRSKADRPSLAWQYADNAWAVISTWRPNGPGAATAKSHYNREVLTDIAAGLSGAEARPTRLAFKVSDLPAGYQLTSAGTSGEYLFSGPTRSYARFVKGSQSYTGLTQPVMGDTRPERSISFELVPRWWSKYSPRKGQPANAPFCADTNLCYRATDDGKYQIELMGSGDESPAELIDVLKALTIADVDEPSNWYDVSAAK